MRIPKYRKYPKRDKAFVQWKVPGIPRADNRHPLPGKFESRESRAAYREFLRKYVLNAPDTTPTLNTGMLFDVLLAYSQWARIEYGEGDRNSPYFKYQRCIQRILDLVGHDMRAADFGPLKLKAYRNELLKVRTPQGRPLSRKYINECTSQVVTIFRWAHENELVPVEVWQSLTSVRHLRAGKNCQATEHPKRRPPKDGDCVRYSSAHPTDPSGDGPGAVLHRRSQRHTGKRPPGAIRHDFGS